ncbi:MAG: hypothetical protein ACRYGG_00830 [Janthinobacterium lividum]
MTKIIFNKLEVNDTLSKETCKFGSVVEHYESKERYFVCAGGWLQLTSSFPMTNPQVISYKEISSGEYWRPLPAGTSFTITTNYEENK